MLKYIFLLTIWAYAFYTPAIANHSPRSNDLYQQLANRLKKHHASALTECNCMKAFYRNLFAPPDASARYQYDSTVATEALKIASNRDTIHVLALGSGTLLNELTACTNLLAQRKNLKIYLMDYAYIFYNHDRFHTHVDDYLKNPHNIPENWKHFSFWKKHKNAKNLTDFFARHHLAIEQFKAIITDMAEYYDVNVEVVAFGPSQSPPVQLPSLDVILSIDSFVNTPAVLANLFYQIHHQGRKPIRLITLNKISPFGHFYDSDDPSMHESDSLHPVVIEVADVTGNHQSGSYHIIKSVTIAPTVSQLRNAPEFKTNPNRNPSQSPFDAIATNRL